MWFCFCTAIDNRRTWLPRQPVFGAAAVWLHRLASGSTWCLHSADASPPSAAPTHSCCRRVRAAGHVRRPPATALCSLGRAVAAPAAAPHRRGGCRGAVERQRHRPGRPSRGRDAYLCGRRCAAAGLGGVGGGEVACWACCARRRPLVEWRLSCCCRWRCPAPPGVLQVHAAARHRWGAGDAAAGEWLLNRVERAPSALCDVFLSAGRVTLITCTHPFHPTVTSSAAARAPPRPIVPPRPPHRRAVPGPAASQPLCCHDGAARGAAPRAHPNSRLRPSGGRL